jgi:hypothetical protein
MPAPQRTAITPKWIVSLTGNPNDLPANSTATSTFTTGNTALPSDFILCSAPSLEAGLLVADAYCTTKGQIIMKLANVTGSPINAASQTFMFIAF